jgi:hypothetical protein
VKFSQRSESHTIGQGEVHGSRRYTLIIATSPCGSGAGVRSLSSKLDAGFFDGGPARQVGSENRLL